MTSQRAATASRPSRCSREWPYSSVPDAHRLFYNNIASTNPFAHDSYVPAEAFESDEIRATIFPPSPESSTSRLPSPDRPLKKIVEIPSEENMNPTKQILTLLQPSDDGWTSGFDSLVTPSRRGRIHEQENQPPSASGRLGFQGLPNSTSAPTITSWRRPSPSPERSEYDNSPSLRRTQQSRHGHSPTRSNPSYQAPSTFSGSPSNRLKYDIPHVGPTALPNTPRTQDSNELHIRYEQDPSRESHATKSTSSGTKRTKSTGRSSEASRGTNTSAAGLDQLRPVRFSPVSNKEAPAEPTKNPRIRVNSKAEQILGSEAYVPPGQQHESIVPEISWYKSEGSAKDEPDTISLQTPESILQYPVGITMEDLDKLLDRSIQTQGQMNRASSVYERTSLVGTGSHRRSRSMSPVRLVPPAAASSHDRSPGGSPDWSPHHFANPPLQRSPQSSPQSSPHSSIEKMHADEKAEMLRTKPLPRTPDKRSRAPGKQMFGENGWLYREGETLTRAKSQKSKQSSFKSFTSRWRQKAEETV